MINESFSSLVVDLCALSSATSRAATFFSGESTSTLPETSIEMTFDFRVYDQYSFQVIPPMGQILASQWEPYQYLVESIRKFPKQNEFKKMIRTAGFRAVDYENLTFGVCAIHSGYKI